MKKLMILGASILQLPAILKAKDMGIKTITVDIDKEAVGFKYSDICLEISTIAIPEVLDAAKQYKIDGIMTLASDMPMRTVAAVAKELNLIGITEETALKATNKGLMRKCLEEYKVPIPRFFYVKTHADYMSAVEEFTDKFIVKPADSSGSRGVFLVERKEDIDYAFDYSEQFSHDGELVIEEFMEGPEVSVESISIEGKTKIIAITDKLTTGAPNFVEMGHSQPTRHTKEFVEQIEWVTKAAVSAIGIENGPSHTEIIITNNGPKIVELGARLGGDNITTHLVPLSTGIDMVECCINISLGLKPELNQKFYKGSAIRYFDTKQGKIVNISNVEKASAVNGVKCICFTKGLGDYMTKVKNSKDRIGYVIAQGSNYIEAIETCEKVKEIISISTISE